MEKIVLEDIRRIQINPGDRLVVRYAGYLTIEAFEQIAAGFEKFAPGTPVLVLEGGATVDVVSSGEGSIG